MATGEVAFRLSVEKFCNAIIGGKSQHDAYIISHPRAATWKQTTVNTKACEFAKRDDVQSYLAELKRKTTDRIVGARERVLGYLLEEVDTCYRDNHTLTPVIKQVQELKDILGWSKQQIEVKEVGVDRETIRDRLNFLAVQINNGRRPDDA